MKANLTRKQTERPPQRGFREELLRPLLLMAAVLITRFNLLMAQSSEGIVQATSEVQSYVDPIANLVIAIGAVVGLIGGVRVYIKWQSGDQDTQKALMGWFGACLFLILVGVVIRAFFG